MTYLKDSGPAPYETRVLDPATLRFYYTPTGILRLVIENTICYLRVKLLSTFPLSDGETFISVREILDGREKEIGLIRNIGELDEESNATVLHELKRYYFIPRITSIKSIKKEFGFYYWRVDTDRGPRTFPMRDSHDSVIQVNQSRIILTDAYGGRFEIANTGDLDKKSRERLRENLFL